MQTRAGFIYGTTLNSMAEKYPLIVAVQKLHPGPDEMATTSPELNQIGPFEFPGVTPTELIFKLNVPDEVP